MNWLLAGYMAQNQYTSKHSHILCIEVAHGCNQYFGLHVVHEIFWQSAGYSLAMGQNQYTTTFQSGTWLQAVVCSQHFLAIGWLPVSYRLPMA